jgi:hypothetical protein
MKKLLILGFLLCSALAFTVDVQPNFIRALPGEAYEITVLIFADSVGFYSLRLEGPGISFTRNYELLPGQTMPVKIPATAPVEPGDYTINAIVSIGDENVIGTANLQVIRESEQSGVVNSTLHELGSELDELRVRVEGLIDDKGAYPKLMEAEALINSANSSYQQGRLLSAQSKMSEAAIKIQQAKTLIELAEESQWNVNITLLVIGVMVIVIAFILMNYLK